MKHKFFILLVCSTILIANMVMTSCSKDDDIHYSTPGTLENITIDRTKIGTHQWVTINSSYKMGQNLTSEEEVKFSVNDLEISSIKPNNGDLSTSVYFPKAGKYTLKFSIRNLGNFENGHYLDVEKTKEIEVVPSDIRCHFWLETREETLHNLANYKTATESDTDKSIRVTEQDSYNNVNYSSEVGNIGSSTNSERFVFYRFDDKDRLNKIQYNCIPQNQNVDKYVHNLQMRRNYLRRDRYNFDSFTYSGINLTEEEKAKVEECIAATNNNEVYHDINGEIGELIRKGLILHCTFKSENNKTKGILGTFYKNGEFSILIEFASAN